MRRHLLIGFALGAFFTLLSMFVSGNVAAEQSNDRPEAYALFFQRPTPITSRTLQAAFEKADDPAPGQPARQFLMRVVQDCELPGFEIDSQGPDDRLDAGAVLYVASDRIGDSQFSCVSNKVRYPYITLERVPQDCDSISVGSGSLDLVFGPMAVCIEEGS